MLSVTYTVPEPGTVNPGHEEFVQAMMRMPPHAWDGDDGGLYVHMGNGETVTLPPGTLVTVIPHAGQLRAQWPDKTAVTFFLGFLQR